MPPDTQTAPPATEQHQKETWPAERQKLHALWNAGQRDQALSDCRAICERRPRNPQVRAKLSAFLFEAGQLTEALAALDEAQERGLSQATYLARKAEILSRSPDVAGFIACAQELVQVAEQPEIRLLKQLSRAYFSIEDYAQTAEVAAAILDRVDCPRTTLMKRTATILALPAEQRLDRLEAELLGPEASPDYARQITVLSLVPTTDQERLKDIARRAQIAWPDDPIVAERSQRLLGGTAPGVSAEQDIPPATQLARAIDSIMTEHKDPGARQRDLQKAMTAQIDAADLKRPLVTNARHQDVLISPHLPGAPVAIMFTGLANRTALPVEAIDAYLARAGVTGIYLRDFNRVVFATGVASLGGSHSETVDGLRRILDELGDIGEVMTLSTSAGGIGAIHYAIELQLTRALCFSAPTMLDLTFLASIGDRRGSIVARRINAYAPPEFIDPRDKLRAQQRPVQIDLVYGADHPLDSAHANAIKGLPGVTLHPLFAVNQHDVICDVIQQGLFPDLLAGDLSVLEQIDPRKDPSR